ncbi:DNA-binding protein [Variovorax sp. YR216]|uniref:DNA-binding protein n=1 Tax=Variovorax sp. YR216 TaxID=1882828 RepID=UPI0008948FDF|nr:DNA-binding protein [Variovorax sp. YR216]SEB22617.1 replication region DNA-binding N-term [Variovorax sp. YR216]
MSQVAEFRGRGIQEADVFAAADALLAEGKRPTIERVRQQIGRGSPNTVSPMLEKWFASLGERLVGAPGVAGGKAAGNDPDGMPLGVRNVARLLWETARREAEEVQRGELQSVRDELLVREAAFAEAQGALAQREEAFRQARVSLDAALASSQQAREMLERQLKDHAIEAHRVRTGLEDEIRRLTALLSQSTETQERMRREHAEAIAGKDQDLRRAEERHTAQERRMLEDVDRARQSAKQAETGFAREQHRRIQSEEAAAQTLEAGRRMLRETQQAAQQLERELRERLAGQAGLLAGAQSQASALQQRLDDFERQFGEERKAHEDTRGLLAGALAAGRSSDKPPRKTAVRRGKPATP